MSRQNGDLKEMIRKAVKSDCRSLAALSSEVWLNTYCADGIRPETSQYVLSNFTEKKFKELLTLPEYKILVFTQDPYIRGYALINLKSYFEKEKNGFEIQRLYVHSPFQGQGVGRDLLHEIKRRYGNDFWLYSWIHNKSLNFYKKFGFKDIGIYEFTLGKKIIQNRVLAYHCEAE